MLRALPSESSPPIPRRYPGVASQAAAAGRMTRALKRVAPPRLGEGQEALAFFCKHEEARTSLITGAEAASTARSGPSTFSDAEGRFVPRCGCGAFRNALGSG